ncbi:MAG TPA: ATP-binding cassette domain-containing protein [Bifidobacterium pullorum]|nr:ATP-binding cassette domain-containing protein [Bifidobacterium pullorum]
MNADRSLPPSAGDDSNAGASLADRGDGVTGGPGASIAAELRNVRFSYDGGTTWALDDVNLTVRTGERLCIVGPNGSGKTTLSRVIAGLAAPDGGTVTLLGERVFTDGAGPDPDAYRRARRRIGAVFQNPEDQIVTTVVEDDVAFGPENLGVPRADIGRRIADALDSVDMAGFRAADPTMMSGGQQQRIAIAGTLAMLPAMVVFDEPTAMLDPVACGEVMTVLDELQSRGTTIVHITHHIDQTRAADRIIRMEAGRIAADVTQGLSSAAADDKAGSRVVMDRDADGGDIPAGRADSAVDRPVSPDTDRQPQTSESSPIAEPAIAVTHVSFSHPEDETPTIDDLSMTVARGETVALMGPNGAGKTTLARLLCALERPAGGTVTVAGIPTGSRKQRRELRRHVGYVMQHPERQLFAETVAQDVAYGPRNQGLSDSEVRERVSWALRLLRIEHLADRSPFALSGGQQRLAAIAGVIACRPDVLVMDEPTAGLDAAASARIHDLVRTLHGRGVTMVIITHSAAEAAALHARIIDLGNGEATPAATADGLGQATAAQRTSTRHAGRGNDRDRHRSGVNGPLGTLDPRVKMVTFLVLMFTAFAISNAWQLGLAAVLTVGAIAIGRVNPLQLFTSVRWILGMLAVMGLLNIFFARGGDVLASWGPIAITTGGLGTAALYTLRFALVVLLGAVMLATTTPTALTDAIGSLLAPLRRFGVHTQEIALVLSLALRFLPTLARETHAIIDAQAARGGDIETGTPAKRLRSLAAITVPVFAGTLRHADHLALALDARCYEEGARRTHWRQMRVRWHDMAFVATAALYLAALAALQLLIQ